MTGISVGDYRDPERGLELGDLMREVAARRGRRARAPVVGRGDPRARLAARRARRGAAHLPAPARAAPVRATTPCWPRWGATTTPPDTSEAVARLRERVPHVNLTTDVIVGYPTEDEAGVRAHPRPRARRPASRRVHTFSFSARPGTEADRLGDPVPPAEKKRRSRELRGLSEALVAPPPRGEARRGRGGAGRQGGRYAGVRLQPRLHALLPAGRGGARRAKSLRRSARRRSTPTASPAAARRASLRRTTRRTGTRPRASGRVGGQPTHHAMPREGPPMAHGCSCTVGLLEPDATGSTSRMSDHDDQREVGSSLAMDGCVSRTSARSDAGPLGRPAALPSARARAPRHRSRARPRLDRTRARPPCRRAVRRGTGRQRVRLRPAAHRRGPASGDPGPNASTCRSCIGPKSCRRSAVSVQIVHQSSPRRRGDAGRRGLGLPGMRAGPRIGPEGGLGSRAGRPAGAQRELDTGVRPDRRTRARTGDPGRAVRAQNHRARVRSRPRWSSARTVRWPARSRTATRRMVPRPHHGQPGRHPRYP